MDLLAQFLSEGSFVADSAIPSVLPALSAALALERTR
jgi:hypothetical protein